MSSSTHPRRGRAGEHVDPSTSQGGTPPQTRLAKIPVPAIKKASKSLGRNIVPDDDDDDIRGSLEHVWTAVHGALKLDSTLKENLADQDEFLHNVERKGEQEFIESLRDMAKAKSWERLFDDEVFLKEKPDVDQSEGDHNTALVEATERAWDRAFKGNAAEVLLMTISNYLDKKRRPYSRQALIVNSSGTGKSRMVDQLATKIITVPMCLRPEKSQGFPPADATLRSWVLSGEISDQGVAQKRLHGFVYALLTVTRTTLESIWSQMQGETAETEESVLRRQAKLAYTFHELMTKGQSFKSSNAYRENFYKKVIESANKFVDGSQAVAEEGQAAAENSQAAAEGSQATAEDNQTTAEDSQTTGEDSQVTTGDSQATAEDSQTTVEGSQAAAAEADKQPKKPLPGRYVSQDREGLEDAGRKLSKFVDPFNMLDRVKGSRRPLVIFAFDEAHILTDNPPNKDWNLFSDLRRILRQISGHAIFSLFLSTAGRFHLFSPETRSDPSSRVRDASERTLDPITEISFDDLAYPAPADAVMLDRVVGMDWMSHLGRPLFGSRWDAMDDQNEIVLMDFAKGKLLDGPTMLLKDDRTGSLACLSVRFSLEFNMDGTASEVIRTQVERHMRLCLAATAGREKFITLAGSEPLLAEAAYELMNGTESNPVHHLARHWDLNCVDRGRRGELVAALLIMRACDAARASSLGNRWVSVDDFMQELLPPSKYKILRDSHPNFWRNDGEYVNFVESFRGYGIWFNHVIKVEDEEMFTADNLWKFVMRGAMVLCAHNQKGIDIVLPICDTQRNLSRDTVTAILVQVKNDGKYALNIKKTLFDGINPITLSLFPDGVVPKPIIRIVFALASREAGVTFPNERVRVPRHSDPFTAFDVWIAGLSTAAYKHLDEDLESYQIMLDRSLRPHDAFDLKDDLEVDIETRRWRGSIRRRMAPLTTTEPGHEEIHLMGT